MFVVYGTFTLQNINKKPLLLKYYDEENKNKNGILKNIGKPTNKYACLFVNFIQENALIYNLKL